MSVGPAAEFRAKVKRRELLAGTFVKTPAPEILEILALAGLDFVCLDAEHAAFGRRELDQCLAMGRALGLPTLVRLSHRAPETILQALDGGAAGLLVPHVRSADEAAELARWTRFGSGGRGYAGSTRQGNFTGRSMPELLQHASDEITVIAQIEDVEALDELGAIAGTPGIDGLFFGAADLAAGLGLTRSSGDEIDTARKDVAAAAESAGIIFGAYGAEAAGISTMRERGVHLAIIGSEQGMILSGARALAAANT